MNIKQNKLYKWLVVLLGDIRSQIIGLVVLYLLSASGILWLKNGLIKPIPLWLVIVICLSILLCCGILFLIYYRHSLSHPPYIVKYWTTGSYKWEAKIYKDNSFDINKYPICAKHDLRFIFGDNTKYCPDPNCSNRLHSSDEFTIIQAVKSIIDKEIRNKKC